MEKKEKKVLSHNKEKGDRGRMWEFKCLALFVLFQAVCNS